MANKRTHIESEKIAKQVVQGLFIPFYIDLRYFSNRDLTEMKSRVEEDLTNALMKFKCSFLVASDCVYRMSDHFDDGRTERERYIINSLYWGFNGLGMLKTKIDIELKKIINE